MDKISSLRGKILEKYVLPCADKVTRQQVMASYRFFKESQWWSYKKLLEYQEKCLRKTLQVAYSEVPFYKDLYDQHGVNVDKILNRSDLVRLPPVSKDILRRAYPEYCTRKSAFPAHEFFTSGSSGQPFAVKQDSQTLSAARALMFLRANFSGWEIGQPILQTGMSLKRGITKRIKDIILGTNYVSAFDLSDSVLDHYLSIVDDHQLRYLMGYPASIYFLAKRARQTGFNHQLQGVVCWGDNLYRHYREEIESVFGCRVTDTYGCGEGIQVAAQCSFGAYHVFMPHVLVEIVDHSGTPVPAGSHGAILLTRLDPGAMPLIRYRVGDIGRMSGKYECPCGRGLEAMVGIDGRDSDVIITPNGNRLIVHFFTGIFEFYPSIHTFKVTQENIEEINVKIVPLSDYKDEYWAQIKEEILGRGDSTLKVNMELVKEIPTEASGKRRFVTSRLAQSKQ